MTRGKVRRKSASAEAAREQELHRRMQSSPLFRDGCCNPGDEDRGAHVVCAQMTAEFLAFSRAHGNDLSTPMPELGFPGLRLGDRWCLESVTPRASTRVTMTGRFRSLARRPARRRS